MHGIIRLGDYESPQIGIGHLFVGYIRIAGNLYNDIEIWGQLGNDIVTNDDAIIEIQGDFIPDPNDPNTIPVISVGTDVHDGWIHILGDMKGQILVAEDLLAGRIYIDGTFFNSVTDTGQHEIVIGGAIGEQGAVTIDYDGYHAGDIWQAGAEVKIGMGDPIDQNTPGERVYRTTACVGDLDNSDNVDSDDWALYTLDDDPFENAAPGCEGSRVYHSDGNFDGYWIVDTANPACDTSYIQSVTNASCCFTSTFTLPLYPTDIMINGQTDLADLAALLASYGKCTGQNGYNPACDVYGEDECVTLEDLAELLAYWGPCPCSSPFRLMESSALVDVSVAAVNTNGYTGGGFVGEVDHFVFDLKIEVSQPFTDDWLVNGAAIETDNDATLRLSTYPTTPDAYATFVAAPWTTLPGSSTANVAGAYSPADPSGEFSTTEANLGWYDTNTASEDGLATVMRIVIDVSEVDGADVSSGFGSVYFSTTGPTGKDDILVAELNSGTGTKLTSGLKTYWGEFYVKGE